MALNVGDKIPAFKIKDLFGNDVDSKDLDGNPWIIFFYSPKQKLQILQLLKSYQENIHEFDELETLILGVSSDHLRSIQSEVNRMPITLPFLNDESLELHDKFGVLRGDQIEPSVFVIDSSGVVVWVEKPVVTKGHLQRLLSVLEERFA